MSRQVEMVPMSATGDSPSRSSSAPQRRECATPLAPGRDQSPEPQLRHKHYVFLAVLVPDLLLVVFYSAAMFGPHLHALVAKLSLGDAAAVSKLVAVVAAAWLALLFVLDVFNDRRGRSKVRPAGLLVLVVLVFAGSTLRASQYPWVPILLCSGLTAPALAWARSCCGEAGAPVNLQRFMWLAAGCYAACACLLLMPWFAWIWTLRWNEDTTKYLASRYAETYHNLYDGPLGDHPLQWYCESRGRIDDLGLADTGVVESACRRASTICFLQWSAPLCAAICNLLGMCICLLFSCTIARIQPEQPGRAYQEIIVFTKRFLLIIILAIATIYASLTVSEASVKLGSAMLALAGGVCLVMFVCLYRELGADTLSQLEGEIPMAKRVVGILRSSWIKAMAVGSLGVLVLAFAALDLVRQQVRICTGVYEREGEDAGAAMYWWTPEGRKLSSTLATWDWTAILFKICVLAEVFLLLLVGSKATFVCFSWLNVVLGGWGWSIYPITFAVWLIGVTMFMNPIVPGSAVYLFSGVVIGAQSQQEGSVGMWQGLLLACVAGTIAKALACVGQYTLGHRLGKSVRVQQFVGVDKVTTLAMESVLKEPGFGLVKVCILVAGPDFPTSMLCGILGLNIPRMLLGTFPVIFVSVIPQTFVGVLLTVKGGPADAVWGMVSTVATGFAAAIQASATLIFSYGIMKTVEDRGERLLAEPRPEHKRVRELAEAEAGYLEMHARVSDFWWLGCGSRFALLLAAGLSLASGYMLAMDFVANDKVCFRKFAITSDIAAPHDQGGLDGHVLSVVIAPLGWAALLLAAGALALHLAIGQWLAATARAEHAAQSRVEA